MIEEMIAVMIAETIGEMTDPATGGMEYSTAMQQVREMTGATLKAPGISMGTAISGPKSFLLATGSRPRMRGVIRAGWK